MKSIVFAGVALAAALVLAPTLSRADDDESRTILVHSGDLDLTTVAGQAMFKARIRAAARDACGRADIIAMQNAGAVSSCYEATLATAMSDANTLIASVQQRGDVAIAAK